MLRTNSRSKETKDDVDQTPRVASLKTDQALLLVSASEGDANMLYAVGMFVPDPFIFFKHKGKKQSYLMARCANGRFRAHAVSQMSDGTREILNDQLPGVDFERPVVVMVAPSTCVRTGDHARLPDLGDRLYRAVATTDLAVEPKDGRALLLGLDLIAEGLRFTAHALPLRSLQRKVMGNHRHV